MREKALAMLNSDTLALWTNLEKFAGLEIQVQQSTQHASACSADHTGAIVYLLNPDGPSDDEVTHELLHIHRYWVVKSPLLNLVDDARGSRAVANHIDNAVEHQWIIPEMRGRGINRASSIDADMKLFNDWMPASDFDARLQCACAALMLLSNELGELEEEVIRAKIRQLGQNGAHGIARKIQKESGKSKERAVRTFLNYMRIPTDALEWYYFDIRNRSLRRVPL